MKMHFNLLQAFRRVRVSILLLSASVTAWADGGANHQIYQTRPIQLGTSGGNINDRSSRYCCSGTLGAAVTKNGVLYILSNNHVLARVNQGGAGDGVNQPGQIDQNCSQANVLAILSDFVPIQFGKGKILPQNVVDAAIAQTQPGAVDGSILDIGFVSSETANPSVGQAVRKSGRTTGHTTGTISSINAIIDVGYSKECGGAATMKARFVNQILINSSTFSAGGDSGSLIVEQANNGADGKPRAIGLLFAGSPSSTIANPINAVLSALNVSMVGGSVPSTSPAGAGAIAQGGAASDHARAVQARHSNALFALDDVVGHGIGKSADGQPVIHVYVAKDNPGTRARVPAALENVPVAVVVTGEFVAY